MRAIDWSTYLKSYKSSVSSLVKIYYSISEKTKVILYLFGKEDYHKVKDIVDLSLNFV